MASRLPPFDRWPPQHEDPHYGYAWYCGKGVIVSSVTITHASVAAAQTYHDFEEKMLQDHAAEVAEHGGIFVIHDWRTLITYEAEARRVWQDRMRERPKGYLRGSIVCLLKAGPLLRMAVQAANVVASVTHQAKVELTTDIHAALENLPTNHPPLSRRF